MESTLLKTLMNLDNVMGVSGDEELVAEVMKKEMEGLYDEYFNDPLGNQFFVKYGKDRDRKVLMSAHMDEIGFMVSAIDDDGFVKVVPDGFHDDRCVVNQDLVIRTDSGKMIKGVTGSKPAHIMTPEDHEKVIPIADLFIDIGSSSKEETLAMGVNIGDLVGFDRQGFMLNDTKYYTGKAIDDRSGIACMVEAARRLKDVELPVTVVFCGSVMEEVGLRAGNPITNRIDPEIMLAIDVALTGDVPGIELSQCSCEMGKGVAIGYFDWDADRCMGNNVPRVITRRLIKLCEDNNIPYQREVLTGGGTDAWWAAMAGSGYLAGIISIPERYMHTAVGTVHMDDMEYVVQLIMAFLKDYTPLR